jgi:hypothetical protein
MGIIYKNIGLVHAADLEAGVYVQGEEGDFQMIVEVNDIYDQEYPAVELTLRDHWGEDNTTVISYDIPIEIFEERD